MTAKQLAPPLMGFGFREGDEIAPDVADLVQVEEHAAGGRGDYVVVELKFPAMDRTYAAALKRLANQLPALMFNAREDQFEARAKALLHAFAPPDPLADEQLRITQADAEARSEFFARVPVLDSKQIALAAGHSTHNPAQTASRWRKAGKIFAIPHGGSDLYPAFQFVDGQPLAVIADILQRFAADPRRTPWQNAFWFASANGWLGGAAPIDELKRAPERVLAAAEQAMAARDY